MKNIHQWLEPQYKDDLEVLREMEEEVKSEVDGFTNSHILGFYDQDGIEPHDEYFFTRRPLRPLEEIKSKLPF